MHQILLVLLLCLQVVSVSSFVADQQLKQVRPAPLLDLPSDDKITSSLQAKNECSEADDKGGYQFGDISRGLAKRFTKRVEQVTGKECKLAKFDVS